MTVCQELGRGCFSVKMRRPLAYESCHALALIRGTIQRPELPPVGAHEHAQHVIWCGSWPQTLMQAMACMQDDRASSPRKAPPCGLLLPRTAYHGHTEMGLSSDGSALFEQQALGEGQLLRTLHALLRLRDRQPRLARYAARDFVRGPHELGCRHHPADETPPLGLCSAHPARISGHTQLDTLTASATAAPRRLVRSRIPLSQLTDVTEAAHSDRGYSSRNMMAWNRAQTVEEAVSQRDKSTTAGGLVRPNVDTCTIAHDEAP